MTRAILLALPLSLLVGCSSPVGTYRIDGSSVLEASCSGVSSARTTAWVDALNAEPASDLQIGSKGGEVQAQLQLADTSVLFAPVTESENNTWVGTRFVAETTTSDALLGSDFSGLLEIDGICHFDLTVDVSLNFGEEGYDAVSADFRATMEETSGGTPCDIQTCTTLIRAGAGRTSSINPGVQSAPE